jgi:hypothetical protein
MCGQDLSRHERTDEECRCLDRAAEWPEFPFELSEDGFPLRLASSAEGTGRGFSMAAAGRSLLSTIAVGALGSAGR